MTITVVRPVRARLCGFCMTGDHENCIVGVKDAAPRSRYPDGSVHICLCEEGEWEVGRRKCLYCNNRVTEEVNPDTWECFDVEACRGIVEARREANPLLRELREAKERAEMAKIEENKEKATKRAAAKPKTGTCVCGCKGTTKGGKFLPGHDARFVSTLVNAAGEKNFTGAAVKEQRKTLTDAGVSDALVAKFDKSVGLAKEKAEKRAAAAKEKADSKG